MVKKLGLDKKGQASAELLFITFIFLIVIGGILTLINSEMNQTQTGELGKARALGEKMAGAINAVNVAGSGYSVNFTIPANVTNPASVIIINSTTQSVDMIYNDNKVSIKVIPKNLATFTTTTSTTTDKIINIKNQDGNIVFS
ncbi:MAG: hypothetical protein KO318_00840 [Methanobacterium sp.]|jgi:uncharacterized protein (UPF0333 family)|uniref:Class III signal peptide-containing protein n=1 Tax=Methanobacterium subterraneum TaxID=59277 RepID=A0A2H4VEJ3_9EURY|nr:hypothetical protein BK007_11165 [Methanobacterium subterraneum]AUB58614.1 hypothetical protein BK008_10025 [Methanobacterium sp. MZ-A1]MBW4257300.1 hypothetical protein [Methanobacterium sp. YSL]MCC7558965.1 hypothetical protein [Methanobacterium sp.]PKL73590.1 MAG: hypothetical protein CVV29_02690 [Methanobacteriales archaeon HGW-Methanobacteriales-2]